MDGEGAGHGGAVVPDRDGDGADAGLRSSSLSAQPRSRTCLEFLSESVRVGNGAFGPPGQLTEGADEVSGSLQYASRHLPIADR